MNKAVITPGNLESKMPAVGQAIRNLIDAGKKVVVEFKEHKTTRTKAQNRLLWRWNQEIANYMREHYGQENSSEDVHEVMVRKKFGVKVIHIGNEEPILVRNRTRKLNTKEFTEYLEWLEMYSAECLQLMLSRPEDLYILAIYGESNHDSN